MQPVGRGRAGTRPGRAGRRWEVRVAPLSAGLLLPWGEACNRQRRERGPGSWRLRAPLSPCFLQAQPPPPLRLRPIPRPPPIPRLAQAPQAAHLWESARLRPPRGTCGAVVMGAAQFQPLRVPSGLQTAPGGSEKPVCSLSASEVNCHHEVPSSPSLGLAVRRPELINHTLNPGSTELAF